MIQNLDQTISTIVKAMRESDATSGTKSTKSPLTRLNNEAIRLRMKEAQLLEFFKELEGRKGDDN